MSDLGKSVLTAVLQKRQAQQEETAAAESQWLAMAQPVADAIEYLFAEVGQTVAALCDFEESRIRYDGRCLYVSAADPEDDDAAVSPYVSLSPRYRGAKATPHREWLSALAIELLDADEAKGRVTIPVARTEYLINDRYDTP